jgi:hypothetical protein
VIFQFFGPAGDLLPVTRIQAGDRRSFERSIICDGRYRVRCNLMRLIIQVFRRACMASLPNCWTHRSLCSTSAEPRRNGSRTRPTHYQKAIPNCWGSVGPVAVSGLATAPISSITNAKMTMSQTGRSKPKGLVGTVILAACEIGEAVGTVASFLFVSPRLMRASLDG